MQRRIKTFYHEKENSQERKGSFPEIIERLWFIKRFEAQRFKETRTVVSASGALSAASALPLSSSLFFTPSLLHSKSFVVFLVFNHLRVSVRQIREVGSLAGLDFFVDLHFLQIAVWLNFPVLPPCIFL